MLWPSVHSPGWLRMKSQTLPTAGPPRRADLARRDLAPHRSQLAGVNSLYAHGDRHSPTVCKRIEVFEVNRGGAFPGITGRAGFPVTARVLRRVPLVQAIR